MGGQVCRAAGASERRPSSGRKIPAAHKKKCLKEIVGRMVQPDNSGKLIQLGELAEAANAAYLEEYGHPARCTSKDLADIGFTAKELEVCKVCGKRALKENCGEHYISRSMVWSPNSTKRKMVSARWKVDAAEG